MSSSAKVLGDLLAGGGVPTTTKAIVGSQYDKGEPVFIGDGRFCTITTQSTPPLSKQAVSTVSGSPIFTIGTSNGSGKPSDVAKAVDQTITSQPKSMYLGMCMVK